MTIQEYLSTIINANKPSGYTVLFVDEIANQKEINLKTILCLYSGGTLNRSDVYNDMGEMMFTLSFFGDIDIVRTLCHSVYKNSAVTYLEIDSYNTRVVLSDGILTRQYLPLSIRDADNNLIAEQVFEVRVNGTLYQSLLDLPTYTLTLGGYEYSFHPIDPINTKTLEGTTVNKAGISTTTQDSVSEQFTFSIYRDNSALPVMIENTALNEEVVLTETYYEGFKNIGTLTFTDNMTAAEIGALFDAYLSSPASGGIVKGAYYILEPGAYYLSIPSADTASEIIDLRDNTSYKGGDSITLSSGELLICESLTPLKLYIAPSGYSPNHTHTLKVKSVTRSLDTLKAVSVLSVALVK